MVVVDCGFESHRVHIILNSILSISYIVVKLIPKLLLKNRLLQCSFCLDQTNIYSLSNIMDERDLWKVKQ